MKKYSLTKNKKEVYGTTFFQIKADMSFGNVSKGELGGYIEKEENLSQDGNAWVSGNARVYGNAWVSGNAEVYGNARVYGNAEVSGNARVSGNAWVSGKIKLIAGYFFGMRYNNEEIKYIENEGQEIIYKGEAKFGDDKDDKKQELMDKADELIKKAEELKEQANSL